MAEDKMMAKSNRSSRSIADLNVTPCGHCSKFAGTSVRSGVYRRSFEADHQDECHLVAMQTCSKALSPDSHAFDRHLLEFNNPHRSPVMARTPPGCLFLDKEKNSNAYLPPPITVLPGLHVSSSKQLSVKKRPIYSPYDASVQKTRVCTSYFSK